MIVHVGDSEEHERAWYIAHSDRGPILVRVQYRRQKKCEVSSIESFYAEIGKCSEEGVYTMLMGEFIGHDAPWLRFSHGTTKEAKRCTLLHTFAHISTHLHTFIHTYLHTFSHILLHTYTH